MWRRSEDRLQAKRLSLPGLPALRYLDEGSGPSLLLLHGLTGAIESWLPNVAALAERFRVLAFDLPGFGSSEPLREPYSLTAASRLVGAFLEETGLRRAALCGHSLGGAVALHLALDQPAVVERLLLVDSAGLGREVAAALRLVSLPFLGEFLTVSMGRIVEQLLGLSVNDPSKIPADLRQALHMWAARPWARAVFLEVARAGVDWTGQREETRLDFHLERLRVPTLILWGEEDRLIPVAHGRRLASLLPGSRLEILQGCGHSPQLEAPEAFNRLAGDFLGRC